MSEISYDDYLKTFNEAQEKIIKNRKSRALSDDELSKVIGGAGNPGEGTCWQCGKPAQWNGSVWLCKSCHQGVSLDDAETIELYNQMEALYGADYLKGKYPVWWDKVKH